MANTTASVGIKQIAPVKSHEVCKFVTLSGTFNLPKLYHFFLISRRPSRLAKFVSGFDQLSIETM